MPTGQLSLLCVPFITLSTAQNAVQTTNSKCIASLSAHIDFLNI